MMQAPVNNNPYERAVKYGLGQRTDSPQGRAISPTPSLALCKHCGEEYCMDAAVKVAEVAHACKAALTDTASNGSTPVKPLRKKQKLDSLATRAKQQQVPEASLGHLPPNAMLTSAIDMDAFIEPLQKSMVKESEYEKMMKLQLEIPGNQTAAYEDAEEDDGFVPGADSPDRRALDELRKGMRIIYKSQSSLKNQLPLKGQSVKKRTSFFRR